MFISKISKNWGHWLWKLFKPTELLYGVLDACRVSMNSLAKVDTTTLYTNLPVGVGSAYSIVTVKDSQIAKISDTDEYKVTGLPSGIIYFCRSLSTVGASANYDYTESAEGYLFRSDPRQYGVLTVRNEVECHFITFNPKVRSLGLQDPYNKFNGSTTHYVNREIAKHDASSAAVNGVNHALCMAAAGVVYSSDEVAHTWAEGGVTFKLTSTGKLLRGEKPSTDTTDGPEDVGAQLAINSRINSVAGHDVFQRLKLKGYEGATGLYVYYSDTADGFDMKTAKDPLKDVIGASTKYGVLRIPKIDYLVTSLSGEEYGQAFACGKFIKAVAWVKSGKTLFDDVILEYEVITPTLIKAGSCIVFVYDEQISE